MYMYIYDMYIYMYDMYIYMAWPPIIYQLDIQQNQTFSLAEWYVFMD